jgi:hypothetical protein
VGGVSADPDEVVVTYTVKDILADIKKEQATGFARLEQAMKGKADKSDLARIEGRLDQHQVQIDELRKRQDLDDAGNATRAVIRQQRVEWHRWAIPTLLTIALILVGLLQAKVI